MTALGYLAALLAAFGLGCRFGASRSASARAELQQERDTMKALAVELHAENGQLRCQLSPEGYGSGEGGGL